MVVGRNSTNYPQQHNQTLFYKLNVVEKLVDKILSTFKLKKQPNYLK
jgi:hypothetical protein